MGSCALLLRAGAGGCARRRSNFLLRRQEKVTKEKATPLSVTPSLRYEATCGARFRRGLAELAPPVLKQTRALIRLKLRSSARTHGLEGSGANNQTAEPTFVSSSVRLCPSPQLAAL